jgi:hypothetical protein
VRLRIITHAACCYIMTAHKDVRGTPKPLAAGVAVAVYFYSRRRGGTCGPADASEEVQPVERFRHHSHAPNTWLEALFYFAEAIRRVLRTRLTQNTCACLQTALIT